MIFKSPSSATLPSVTQDAVAISNAVSPDADAGTYRVYARLGGGYGYLDPEYDTFINSVSGVDLSDNEKWIYVTLRRSSSNLVIIDANTLEIVKTLTVGNNPYSVTSY